jgi:lysophospholipid acyltransferase (LPLAT)-like uncharacterized protein
VLGARLLALAVGAFLACYRALFRIETLHAEHFETLAASGRPILFALWHGRMFCPILHHRRQGIVTMASQSKDGEIIARWLARNGYRVARGSTNKRGLEALEEMADLMRREHRHGALTVDGPRGPAGVVKAGAVRLARETGAWVLPITYASTRPRRLRSWDRYLLPRPFSTNVVAYGEPLHFEQKTATPAAVARLQEALERVTAQVDEYVSRGRSSDRA